MGTEIGTLKDLVTTLETKLKPALEEEELRLLEQKTLLQEIYSQVVGDFKEKTAVDLTVTFTLSLMEELSPSLYVAIESE